MQVSVQCFKEDWERMANEKLKVMLAKEKLMNEHKMFTEEIRKKDEFISLVTSQLERALKDAENKGLDLKDTSHNLEAMKKKYHDDMHVKYYYD